MKSKSASTPPRPKLNQEQRKRRFQQIVFSILAMIIIFTWVISLVVNL